MACVAFLMEGMEKNIDLLLMSPTFTPFFSIQGGKTIWWVSFGLSLMLVAKATVGFSASNISSGLVDDGITINSNKSFALALWGIY